MKGFMARKNPAAVATANGAQDSFASSAQHSTAAVHVQMMRLFPASRRAHATYDPDEFAHTRRADGKLAVLYRTVRQPVTLDLWISARSRLGLRRWHERRKCGRR